jgi:hypothetical protein
LADLSRENEWKPVFPDPPPPHWVAFVNSLKGIIGLSDVDLDRRELVWLAAWLSHYSVREPDATVTYVYLGLAEGWADGIPDGTISPMGVSGAGSGKDFGDSRKGLPSSVGEIFGRALSELPPAIS